MRMLELELQESSVTLNHPVNVSQRLCGSGFVFKIEE